jgi:hypothetical protein
MNLPKVLHVFHINIVVLYHFTSGNIGYLQSATHLLLNQGSHPLFTPSELFAEKLGKVTPEMRITENQPLTQIRG